MPPSSPSSGQSNICAEGDPPLTNQDVAILYQIVTSAQRIEGAERLPFRAIFAAYDDVLSRNGLDPDHDQVYLRFLFRLGDRSLQGQNLYEKFEALLADFGIQIEIDTDDNGSKSVTTNLPSRGRSSSPVDQNVSPRRSWPASSSVAYATDHESARTYRRRDTSRASLSRLEIKLEAPVESRPSTRATTRATERMRPQTRGSRSYRRNGVGLRGSDSAGNPSHHHRRASLQSSHEYDERLLKRKSKDERNRAYKGQHVTSLIGQNLDDSDSTISEKDTPLRHHDFSEATYQSDIQFTQYAYTFQHFRIRHVTHNLICKWRERAQRTRKYHAALWDLAVVHDQGMLLQQSFAPWQFLLQNKRQIAETEKFFDHLGWRAGQARNLYLLTKAFSHWAQCAIDEIQRTSIARRHIIRTRYFNAWRDVTAVNEFKVRRAILCKFHGVWTHRLSQKWADDNCGITLYYYELTKTVYWRWFWTFCERRAPLWRSTQLKKRCLSQWIAASQKLVNQVDLIEERQTKTARKTVFHQWLSRARCNLTCQMQADSYMLQRLRTKSLHALHMHTQHAPLVRQVSSSVDWRIARSAFVTSLTRLRFERYAATISSLRLKRNAWTTWNDRLRWQTLARRIDDRMVLQALYKWVIAGRFVLLRRFGEQRNKYKVFSLVTKRWSLMRAEHNEAYQTLERGRNRRLMISTMSHFNFQVSLHHQRQLSLIKVQGPRLQQETMQSWTLRLRSVQKLVHWSEEAQFYFSTKKCIKSWRRAVAEAKRQKRRIAYAHVRRFKKIALTTNIIIKWQAMATEILSMRAQAIKFNLLRHLRYGSVLFDSWKYQSMVCRDKYYEADAFYNTSLVHQHIYIWVLGRRLQASTEVEARLFAESHVSSVAFVSLEKIRFRLFELKSSDEKAESWRQWKEKKRLRRMLRYWYDKFRSRKSQAITKVRLGRSGLDFQDNAGEGLTGRAEDWTAFDDAFEVGEWMPAVEAQSSLTPMPAYLSTPSKRAAQARARVRWPTTPATPAGTPFENRVTKSLASNTGTSYKGDLAKSVMGLQRRGIRELSEGSPWTPNFL